MNFNNKQTISNKIITPALISAIAISGIFAVTLFSSATTFSENTLIRNEKGEVFVIKQGQRVKINSINDLRRDFRGKQIINVDNNTLSNISLRTNNSGTGKIKNNSLVRGDDGKVFLIKDGQKSRVSSLNELRSKFKNWPITNVSANTINQFPTIREDNPSRLSENGVKLRGDGTVDDNQASHNGTDDNTTNGVKLRGDGTIDDNSSVSGKNRGSDDNSSGGSSSSGGGSSGSGRSGGGSSDD